MDIERKPHEENGSETDDDGRIRRTGNLCSATAHIITAVIGSGVLSLAWAIAQLGWIAGPVILVLFSIITWYTSCLLADCYRFPGPIEGTRNYSYIGTVRAHLGGFKYKLCGVSQYANLIGSSIGYTITSAISMAAIKRSNCFHKHGHQAGCHTKNNQFMIIFGIIEIILSQLPDFHELTALSVLAAIMSLAYTFIGLGLAIAKIAGDQVHPKTSITGTIVGVDVTSAQKIWNALQAVGNIAFAYNFSPVLVEIQDTLRSSPPESKVMKKATLLSIAVTSLFYLMCGTLGYAAFGNNAPGNFLTGFGFYEPFWLVDIANLCIVLHLVGAYQVFCQPTFKLVEDWCTRRWGGSKFIAKEYKLYIPLCGTYPVNGLRLIWRTAYVIFTSIVAMLFPVFNSVLGLIGAISFFPLAVYFPSEMHIRQNKLHKHSSTAIALRVLGVICLIVSVFAATASVEGIVKEFRSYEPFQSVS
ncbi:hypothetical protein Tsubulata_004307 [Turnera subulata]|uniref:Amino acid transporter transmembrane domain-containing protein n=1 Tax=Turnera subulata TaxID=218843 RepID=A0A9Q0F3P1_9ROSI|nr:hypothetical protein Tsubulata_004307 [Turnera subulata]